MAALKFPDDVKYAKSDEWIRVAGDDATIGISDYAQDALNDIVFVELPEVGDKLQAGKTFGVVESVKAAGDLMIPVSGEVTEINSRLEEEPELVNTDPYGAGWMIKIKVSDASALKDLLDAKAYQKYCDEREA